MVKNGHFLKKLFRLVNTYNIHIIRFHFWRGFRICARFGLIRHFIGQIHVKPDFNGQIWQKSPKVDESSHVTHFSIATYEKIPNLCLIWSNSIILSVKCTSNRVLLIRNVKSPQVTWIMSYGPLYHCLFGEDNEFVPSLTFFGILWKNGIEQGVKCHDSSILGDVCHIWPY